MGYSVKTENYRYTEWQDISTGEVLARELYDHQVDRAENVNVAYKDEYKEIVEKRSQILKKYSTEKSGESNSKDVNYDVVVEELLE